MHQHVKYDFTADLTGDRSVHEMNNQSTNQSIINIRLMVGMSKRIKPT